MAHEKLRPNYFFDEEKIAQLKQLAPECFEDGKINFETLKQNLGDFSQNEEDPELEHFGLFWPGKRDARKAAVIPPIETLEPVFGDGLKADGNSDADGENGSKNIFIEGENLEVLKLLQKSYANKIKLIYIDPPYNTGNDFVYDDDFTETLQEHLKRTKQIDEDGKALTTNKRSDGRFHSKWLSMMYPRLRLARNLLRKDGVIFISIDDNEIFNLRNLCNELFGEENFLAQIIWSNGRTSAAHYTREHEYILAFSKNIQSLPYYSFLGDDIVSDRAIKKPGPKNPLSEITFPAGIDFESEDKIFPEQIGGSEPMFITKGTLVCENKKLKEEVTIKAAWSMADQIRGFINSEEVYDQKGQKLKRFYFKENGILQYEKEKGTIHPRTIISDFSYKNSSSQLEKLLNAKPFDYSKPIDLLNSIFEPVLSKSNNLNGEIDHIILDFFAGSGSTGHSIFELNKFKSWSAKFILVQLPEPLVDNKEEQKEAYNFCKNNKLDFKISEISKFRLKKAEEINQFNNGFKSLKLVPSNYKPWKNYQGTSIADLETKLSLFNESPLRDDYTKDGLLTEIMLLEGFTLCSTISKVSEINTNTIKKITSEYCEHALLVCLDDKIEKETIASIQLGDADVFICLDSAISTEDKLRLSDKGLIKTI